MGDLHHQLDSISQAIMPEIRIHQLLHNSRQTQRTYLLMCMWPVSLLMHTPLLLAIIDNLRMLWHILDAHALRCILIVGLIHVRLHYYIRLQTMEIEVLHKSRASPLAGSHYFPQRVKL